MNKISLKRALIISLIFLTPLVSFAIDESNPTAPDIEEEEFIIEKSTQADDNFLYDAVIHLDATKDGDATSGDDDDYGFLDTELSKFQHYSEYIFKKRKRVKFEDNFFNEIAGELRFQGVLEMQDNGSRRNILYPYDINGVLEAKFADNKYRFFTEYAFMRDVSDMKNPFTGKFSNVFIERKINENHLIRTGVSRSPIGIEGSMSSYALPFANRGQISRQFGDAISTGVSAIGHHKGFEYNAGLYSSTRFMQGINGGPEFIGRVGYNPFYNSEGSYLKDLKLFVGADIGKSDAMYQVYTAAALYEYKKFLINMEYAYADGSNGDFYDSRLRQGFFTTVGYNITPKLQLLARYDYLDQDLKTAHNGNIEYSVGLNYFIYQQRLKFQLNYVFSQDQETDRNSNGVFFVTQFYI